MARYKRLTYNLSGMAERDSTFKLFSSSLLVTLGLLDCWRVGLSFSVSVSCSSNSFEMIALFWIERFRTSCMLVMWLVCIIAKTINFLGYLSHYFSFSYFLIYLSGYLLDFAFFYVEVILTKDIKHKCGTLFWLICFWLLCSRFNTFWLGTGSCSPSCMIPGTFFMNFLLTSKDKSCFLFILLFLIRRNSCQRDCIDWVKRCVSNIIQWMVNTEAIVDRVASMSVPLS